MSLNCPSDLVFTKTVLIHISPEKLVNVYKNLYENALKYILVAEYYNPNPIDVLYRDIKVNFSNGIFVVNYLIDIKFRTGRLWI